MDKQELLKFFRDIIIIVALLFALKMIIESNFVLNSIKIESKVFNIEVFGHEKSVQPYHK